MPRPLVGVRHSPVVNRWKFAAGNPPFPVLTIQAGSTARWLDRQIRRSVVL